MARLRIIGGKVWRGTGIGWTVADVLCEDGSIAEVGESAEVSGAVEIRAEGTLVIPGVIDPQVHFREPGLTQKEDLGTGSAACAAGGVTTYFEMPNTNPPTITAEAMRAKQELAATKSIVNFAFFVGATPDNVAELNAAEHVCGIKIFMGASTGSLLVHEQSALERIFAETDPRRVIALHCEDEERIRKRTAEMRHRTDPDVHSEVRDNEVAWRSSARAIDLAERHGHRAHILHLSAGEEVELLRKARDRWNAGETKVRGGEARTGVPVVTSECAPHHLMFHRGDYPRLGGLIKMNPALKSQVDCDALWQGLRDGLIDCVATDHAPHLLEEKQRSDIWQVPAGVPAIENSLGLMLRAADEGRCTLEQVMLWMCEMPAWIYGLGNKGRIAKGKDADIVLVDPQANHLIENERQFTRCKWSPWHGERFAAWPVMTIVGGQVAFRDGKVNPDCRGRNVF